MSEDIPKRVFNKLPKEKQERILTGAVNEFATHGFHQASINRLVEKLGIAKGSIFQYFGNKEGLFRVVFDYCIEMAKGTLREIKHWDDGVSFFDKIRATALAGIRFAQEHPEAYRLYLKVLFQKDFPLRENLIKRVHLFSAEYLRELVLEGIRRGEINPNIDVRSAVFFLDALLDRFVQAYVVEFWDADAGLYHASDDTLNNFVEHLVFIIANGLNAHNKGSVYYEESAN